MSHSIVIKYHDIQVIYYNSSLDWYILLKWVGRGCPSNRDDITPPCLLILTPLLQLTYCSPLPIVPLFLLFYGFGLGLIEYATRSFYTSADTHMTEHIIYRHWNYSKSGTNIGIWPKFLRTYSSTSNSILFISIRRLSILQALALVIASAGFDSPFIYLTSATSLCLYASQRYIILIISLFLAVVPSLTKQLYNDFKLI